MSNTILNAAPMIFADSFIEHRNIGWRVELGQGASCNPLLEPKYPWDSATPCSGHGTVLKDPIDGVYKGWIVANVDDPNYSIGQAQFRLVYVCSKDGLNWERPELDLCPFPGYPKTNVLFDFNSGGKATYASVFIEPERNAEEPYEMFVYRDPGFRCPTFTVAGFGQNPLNSAAEVYEPGGTYGLYRYRSRDGIRWRGVEGPLNFKSGDTLFVHRNKEGNGFVAHHKNSIAALPGGYVPYDVAAGECRISLRKTSPDGTHWSESTPILLPDWRDHPCDQIMELGYFPYGEGIVGVTAVYHAMSQVMDLQFAASTDGLKWWRPSRQACLPLKSLGDYGSGMIWPTRTLIEDAGKWHLYYGALNGLHGDIYSKVETCMNFHGAFCRASWDVGRLWAAVPANGSPQSDAILTTLHNVPIDKRLYINAQTLKEGQISAELVDLEMKPLAGFKREDFVPFAGDGTCVQVRWKREEVCRTRATALRFYIRSARLYGFRWA